jgi:hypothetical protein
MRTTTFVLPLSAALLLGTAAYAQSDNQPMNSQPSAQMNNAPISDSGQPRQNRAGGMKIDQETTVDGIQAACTGVGDQEENRARWADYPVKLVVAGDHGQYYADEHVSITRPDGRQVADMTCNGPWVLMKLEPGRYRATVNLPGHAAKDISFRAPARGQHEVTVHFASTDEDFGGRNQYRATQTGFHKSGVSDDRTLQGTDENNNTASSPH